MARSKIRLQSLPKIAQIEEANTRLPVCFEQSLCFLHIVHFAYVRF